MENADSRSLRSIVNSEAVSFHTVEAVAGPVSFVQKKGLRRFFGRVILGMRNALGGGGGPGGGGIP